MNIYRLFFILSVCLGLAACGGDHGDADNLGSTLSGKKAGATGEENSGQGSAGDKNQDSTGGKQDVSAEDTCLLVQGNRYRDLSAATSMALQFTDAHKVVFGLDSQYSQEGMYECKDDTVQIRIEKDDPLPWVATVLDGGAQISLTDTMGTKLLQSENIEACLDVYAPVCAKQLPQAAGVACGDTCDIRVYKTFSNICYANLAHTLFDKDGSCGDSEDKFVDSGHSCDSDYTPVCSLKTKNEPCLQVPCVFPRYMTYSNVCESENDGADFFRDGECGELEGEPKKLDTNTACTAQYDPVCGLISAPINCITEPCPTYEYKTFSNSCDANREGATILRHDECGDLQGLLVFGHNPIRIVDSHDSLELDLVVNPPSAASIDGDVYTATLNYSGCDAQHVEMQISPSFLESYPVQVDAIFRRQEMQLCKKSIQFKYEFDLTPLKYFYLENYGGSTGQIALPGGVVYSF